MVKYTLRTTNTSGRTSKVAASRKLVTKAAQLLRSRNAMYPRAPLSTRGYYGNYYRRGRDELKYVDTQTVGTVGSSGAVTLLNGIAQGDDITNRIGRKCMMKSLYFRMDLYPATTTVSDGDLVRILVVCDLQSNAAAPTTTQILQNNSYNSPMNLDYRDRFKIILDKNITMVGGVYTAGTLTGGEAHPRLVKIFKRLNMETVFNGTGNTIGSIATGSIYLLILARNNNATIANLYSRVRYTDS